MEQSVFRAIWISDTHLGGRNLQNQKLLQFLLSTESEFLYLVGDILDLWKVWFRWFWPKINDQIIVDGLSGWMDNDLNAAAVKCLDVKPANCRSYAMNFTWQACTDQFLENLCPAVEPCPDKSVVWAHAA